MLSRWRSDIAQRTMKSRATATPRGGCSTSTSRAKLRPRTRARACASLRCRQCQRRQRRRPLHAPPPSPPQQRTFQRRGARWRRHSGERSRSAITMLSSARQAPSPALAQRGPPLKRRAPRLMGAPCSAFGRRSRWYGVGQCAAIEPRETTRVNVAHCMYSESLFKKPVISSSCSRA